MTRAGGIQKLVGAFVSLAMVASAGVVAVAAVVAVAPSADAAFNGRGANGKIAFTRRNATSHEHVFVADANGANAVDISTRLGAADNDHDPEFSHDGTRLALASDLGAPDIWVMKPDGSGATNLTQDANQDRDPSWSPDGTKIAYQRYGASWDIYVIDVATGNTVPVVSGITDEIQPAWSPTGPYIVFTRGNQLWEVNVSNLASPSVPVQLTFAQGNTEASWSPDGTQLSWLRNSYNIMVGARNNMGAPVAAYQSGGGVLRTSWSPDATKIIYIEGMSGGKVRSITSTRDSTKSGQPAPVDVDSPPGGELDFDTAWALKTGSITIHETSAPNDGTGYFFAFSPPVGSAQLFGLSNGGVKVYPNLAAASYVVTQSGALPGRAITQIACTAGGSGNIATRAASMTITNQGQDIVCGFTHRLRRPDGSIKKVIPANDPPVGMGAINSARNSAQPQFKSLNVKRTKSGSFYVPVKNSGVDADSFKILGTGSSPGFTVSYALMAGTKAFPIASAKVNNGTYLLPAAPGATRLLRITVKVSANATLLSPRDVLVTATSSLFALAKDTVRARTTAVP